MVSRKAIEEISKEIRSVTHCPPPLGHHYAKVLEAKDREGNILILMECEGCQDVQECLLTEAMARQFLMPRKPNEMMRLLLHGHKYAETEEIDPFTGKTETYMLDLRRDG